VVVKKTDEFETTEPGRVAPVPILFMSQPDYATLPPQMSEAPFPNAIDADLLEILRCPVTRSRLRQEGDWLVAEIGGLSYPVRDGIPVMLAEEAKLPANVATLEDLKKQFGAK
jgi:uncharacterized protein YbaR (Trm112 family)